MQWFGPRFKVDTFNAPNDLVFVITDQQRKANLLLAAIMAVADIVFACYREWAFTGVFAVFAILFFLDFFPKPTLRVEVTAGDITVFKGPQSRQAAFVRWAEIQRLTYTDGGRYTPAGLLAKRSFWSQTYIIRGINRSQADEILQTIRRRFPQCSGSLLSR